MSNYRNNNRALAEMFKALGNPHRLRLFHRLTTCCQPGTRCDLDAAMGYSVGELGEGLDIAPSTLSHHLKALHLAGLIEMERRGKQVICWIEPSVLQRLSGIFSGSVEIPIERIE
jgi:ArsR family transcriptional regulator, arsenate/arsenite/antimonite-responsive transcriptional repressor